MLKCRVVRSSLQREVVRMATSRSFHRNQRLHMRRWAAIAAAALTLSTLLAFFGSRVVSAVGDLTVRVYTDTNRNGQYDSEPGVSGVPVSVYNTDNNLLFSVNTNASGLAIFPNTPNGDYRVEVTNPGNGAPNGTVISLPGSTTPGQDNALVFFVTINNAPVQRDVGLRSLDASGVDTGAPAGYRTIVVRAWDDRDANGIQDAGEPGISGLTLGLYTPLNVLVATATTGPDGTYRFVDNVPANVSNYTIRVTGGIPAGYVLTTPDANFDSQDQRDSDAQLVAGEPRITVPNRPRGVNDDSLDVGFSRGAVSGFVWRDLDQNGLRDPGEPFINGVTVELRDSSNNLIGAPQTTRSILNDPANRAGFFEFTSVPLTATYRVRIPNAEFNNPTDLLFGHATPLNQTATPPAIGDQGLVNGTTDGPLVIGAGDFLQTPDFTLDATNRRNETSNFGLYAGTVGDFVWHDVNRNGIVDPLETTLGLANALVFVDLDSDCLIDTNELTTTTDLTGYYRFDSLPLGYTYTVVLDASNFAPGGALEGLGYTTGAACGSTEGVVITTTLLTANTPADFGVDFGIARAEIGNFVWEDDNGNGIFDLGESGVPSVTVQLYGAGPDGFFFTADDVTVGVSQTTNASGIYTITDILSGTYYARFDLSALPPNYVASVYTPTGWLSVDPLAQSSDDVNDVRAFVSERVWRTPTFTITRGSQNPGVDAAVFQPVPLSGRVFFDQNGNNQDETTPEPGLANFTVNLRRASDDALVTTTTTLADGSYTFSSVAPLTYVVEIVRPDPANWSFVTPDVPSAGNPLASDVDANGRTGVISVTSGITVTDVDAGLRGNNIVQGRVFYDRDGSFTQTGNDQDLSGATATLTVTVATINLTTTYTLTATTGAGDPNYSFTGIPGGTSGVTYTLTFDPPDATYTPSTTDVGTDTLDSDGPFIQVTGATVGVSNTLDYDQGYWRPVTVRARIFDEITNLPPDNVYNAGDTGITTATVTITTTNGTVAPLSSSGIDSTGVVTFTLPPTTTTYWLNVPTPAWFTPSPGNTGALAVNTPNPLLADDTAPTTNTEFLFGYFRAATITGTVRFDRDGDNVLFADNEPGMQGVTVTLRLGGSDVLTTTTDATGAYTFTNVPPANNYSVRVINPDPTNFLLVTPAAGDNDLQTPVGDDADTAAFNVAPGATVGGSSDAAVRGRATVTGQVWEDLNGNGQRDAGETVGALPNVPVTLTVTVNLPGLLSTTITTNTVTSGGFYTFTALPGWANASNEVSFTLGFATPSGWFATLPDVGAPATDSDGSGTGVDQLDNQPLQRNTTETRDRGYYRPAVIQVRVFEENPPVDNIYAAGDAPLTATITLTPNVVLSGPSAQDATGIITYTVAPTTTAYVIGVTTPSGYTPSPGNTGTLTVTAPLTSNTTFGPLEFGYFQAGTVTGAVRFDRDGDNVLFADTEPGMQGVTVTLRLGGSDVLTTTTDATGAYTFTGVLPANGYQVRVINPDSTNFLLVTPAGGDNDLQTPVGDDADTAAFNVAPGATVSGLSDAAVRGRATVTGQVWEDLNGNGQRDAGEGVGALPGVPVTLTVTVNLPGLLSTTITTNTVTSGGFYTFTALPGWANASNEVSFTLGFATPSGWFATLPDVGAPATDSDGSGTGVDQLDNQPLQRNTTETRDRGYYRPAVIQVRVFEENPPVDNIYAAGDAPLTATITLTPNVVLSGPSAQDATGIITYTVAPTTTAYVIGVTTPSGYTPSPGNTGTLTVTAPLTSNTTFGPLEFGYFQAGTVTGAVRFDRDGDNDLFADTEPGMQGVTVTLRLGGSDVLTTTTDATGAYTFTTVTPANNYSVRVINPDPTNFLLVTPAGGDNDMATTDIGNTYAETAAFSVTSGATVGGLSDAAVRGRATVTGQVWEDLDGDGVRDAGETVGALPGVTVNLTVTVNLPGRLSTTITANTTTNASGVYTFTALPGGISAAEAAFTLRFATPSGWFDTLTDVGTQPASDDSDGIGAGVDQLDDQALGRGATETRDRGYYRPAVIQVRVFEENPPIDNVYAAGDVPLSATITLTPNVVLSGPSAQDATGIITYTVAPTTTDYVIGVMTPSGYSPSPGNTGTVTVTAPLTSNTTYGPLAFGYFRPGTVTGTVRFDRDGDNILFADNEPGMQGVTVTLRLGGSDVLTTTTDATGAYTFTTVTPANNYSVRVINPDPTNFLLVTPAGGDNDMAATDGGNTYAETAPFTVTSGAAISRTAAVRGRATVTGQVWEDLNGNGQRDAGETVGALPEVTVNLTVTVNLPGLLSTTITTNTTTNASGFYTFTALPGWANASTEVSFTLGFATPSGWFETPADVGAQATDSDGIGTGVDQLNDQELQRNTTETRDRGYYRPAVIQVRVFEETTSPINNVYASGDAPITGATVTLTPNVTLGGPFGPDATGIISYTVTPTTTAYTVGVTAPAAYFPSPGNTGTATAPAPLISGQTITPLPFGYYRNGVISGTVWFDANVNGTFNTGEPTMAGVTVTLHLDPDATVNGNEALIGTFTTGDNGIYQFTNITPTDVLTTGTLYRVRFELPTGYAFTTQGALTTDNNSDANTTNGYTDRFSVGSNETVTYVDAGAVGNLSLSGTAWEDTDADGTFDAGETGLPGVTLTLTVTTSINSTNPTVVYTVTTGAGSPNFTFNQLPAGNYQLSVTAKPLGYLLSTTGTLSGTLPATGQNFGLYRTAAVGDRVWLDVNGNGTYDTGVDAGLPGVTVRLRDASTDVVISTTTTLASGDVGFYGFENVTPGSYVVEFVVPSGFQTVNNGAGSLSVDNDNDAQSNGRTAPFVLASNQISTTVDAGLIGDGSISGIAWIDENFDDIRNPGETQRVSGVQVTLTITPTALSSSLTLSTTTNASGVYTFTNLPPGTFVLTFTRPAGYFDITPRVGSDPTVDSDAPVATGTLGAGQSITTLDAGYRTQMRVFLPLIMAPMTPPDLVVEAFTVTPAKSSYAAGEPVLITVKVKNVGGSPTTVGFWVDLYINPSTPPTTPNVRWNDVCGISPCYGIAWYVNQSLAPGQSITLTSAPGQFAGPQSIWPGSFASGTNALYVYVDSYNPPVPTGAVVESNETNNRAQITGFVVAGASFSNGADPGAPSGAPDAPIALPPRELPGPVEP
jgi:phage terminase large subunit-like protein